MLKRFCCDKNDAYLFNVGFILGSVDDILQILDDNSMNLQSMTASRFVGPFLESVNKWEKNLSHISEVVEVGCKFFGVISLHVSLQFGFRNFSSCVLLRVVTFWTQNKDGTSEECRSIYFDFKFS